MPELELQIDLGEEEVQLAKAEELFGRYPKHVLAFALAKLEVQYKMVHPELMQATLDLSDSIPLQLFLDALKERKDDRKKQTG